MHRKLSVRGLGWRDRSEAEVGAGTSLPLTEDDDLASPDLCSISGETSLRWKYQHSDRTRRAAPRREHPWRTELRTAPSFQIVSAHRVRMGSVPGRRSRAPLHGTTRFCDVPAAPPPLWRILPSRMSGQHHITAGVRASRVYRDDRLPRRGTRQRGRTLRSDPAALSEL